MKFARINFAEKPLETRSVRALLALLLVVAVLSVLRQMDQSSELQQLQTKLSLSARDAPQTQTPKDIDVNDRSKNADWIILFDALERSATPSITLMSIKPDPTKRLILLSGITSEPQSIARYTASLGEHKVLHNIRIQSIRKTENSANPYAFNLEMAWDVNL